LSHSSHQTQKLVVDTFELAVLRGQLRFDVRILENTWPISGSKCHSRKKTQAGRNGDVITIANKKRIELMK